ncbi:MAG: hypothetical protein EP329_01300 [Deltaproteobacteria bacterium]|nr:MAG: hypothetical protein EP329_01300 [Deltaproteobacteria bacterium]
MSPTPARPDFSAKRAALHAGLVAAAAVVVLAVLATALGVRDPVRFGQGAGTLVAFLAAFAFGVSWLAQIGRRRTAWAVGIGFGVLLVGAIIAAVSSTGRWVTDADRAPLAQHGEGVDARLVNDSLGFSLRAPGDGFVVSEEAAAMFGEDPDHPTWAWLDQSRGVALVVTIEPGFGPNTSPARVEEYLAGMIDGIRLTVSEREVTWTGIDPGFHLAGTVGGQPVQVTGRGARLGKGRHPAAVIVMTMGDSEGVLDPVHRSIVVP